MLGWLSGRRARLLFETPQSVGSGGECRWQDFDCHVAAQPRIAGAIDLAHSAGAEHGLDFVRAEARSALEGHCSVILHNSNVATVLAS